ncbi:hypothetical protein CYMTET_31547 [Cymbomonas tetramitiformis]|uniref:Uncharacterized protein n=1 Tax=Cymbomonas tetramitiformis TaxID=36881 RepID=A0AAE0KSS4_9CHLO|nr:hypothetical protein CYMTET_31547 [Cymbomonas tetramitiformis]
MDILEKMDILQNMDILHKIRVLASGETSLHEADQKGYRWPKPRRRLVFAAQCTKLEGIEDSDLTYVIISQYLVTDGAGAWYCPII